MPIFPQFYSKNGSNNLSIYGQIFLHFFYPDYPEFSINFWRMLGSGPKKTVVGEILRCFFENLLLDGEMLKIASLDVLLAGEMLKIASLDVLLAGEMLKIVSLDVLLAGEKLKKKMECASGWGNVKNFFENVLLAGEILKEIKMLKMGGTMFVHIRHQYTNMVPPIFNIFIFFRISPARSTFRKSF